MACARGLREGLALCAAELGEGVGRIGMEHVGELAKVVRRTGRKVFEERQKLVPHTRAEKPAVGVGGVVGES